VWITFIRAMFTMCYSRDIHTTAAAYLTLSLTPFQKTARDAEIRSKDSKSRAFACVKSSSSGL
jgi:hypothetical protein